MRARRGARVVPVSTVAAASTGKLLGGPLRLCGWSLADGVATQSLTVDQSVAAPGAGVQIAALSLPSGPYSVSWTFELSGTPGAGDVDNVRLTLSAATLATSVNLGVANNYPQEEVQPDVVNGPVSLVWKAIGAATAGTVYKIEANAIPLVPTSGIVQDGNMTIANFAVGQGLADNNGPGEYGVQVDTELSLTSLTGAVTGVLYYELNPESPNYSRDEDDMGDEHAY